MAETVRRTVAVDNEPVLLPNDKVPDRWKELFTNQEWYIHDIVVKSTYGFMCIALIAHLLVWLWRPWG
jgi:light-harvesting complex 1 beta chain